MLLYCTVGLYFALLKPTILLLGRARRTMLTQTRYRIQCVEYGYAILRTYYLLLVVLVLILYTIGPVLCLMLYVYYFLTNFPYIIFCNYRGVHVQRRRVRAILYDRFLIKRNIADIDIDILTATNIIVMRL